MQRLGGQIATGEFGAVVRGEYNGRPVAIKTIKRNADKNMVEFFRQVRLELQALSAVGSHPNIVQLLGATAYFPGPGDGPNALRMEIVLELVPNGTLWQALHRGKLFTKWGEKIQLLQGIADGVQYLHSKSIVHRDLSSANILLSAQWTPKIADFGCARITSGGCYSPKKILGSPAYMSPEQLSGFGTLTTKSDVWGLGVLIWEVMSERGPWGNMDSNNRYVLHRHIVEDGGKLPPIADTRFELMYARHFQEKVATILAGCFRVTASKRCSASDVVRALRGLDGPLRKRVIGPSGVVGEREISADGTSAAMTPGKAASTAPSQRSASKSLPNPADPPDQAGLAVKIRAFYSVHNPSKMRDAHLVAKYHVNNQALLNGKLRKEYSTDLVEFCRLHPELDTQPLGRATQRECSPNICCVM